MVRERQVLVGYVVIFNPINQVERLNFSMIDPDIAEV